MPVAGQEPNEEKLSRLPLESSGDGDMEHPILEHFNHGAMREAILEHDTPTHGKRDQINGSESDEILAEGNQSINIVLSTSPQRK